jgi:2-octaprenyl-6-methoxyphenol hydroxylase
VRWRAQDDDRDRFGAVVMARRLLASLRRAAEHRRDIELTAPARVEQAVPGADGIDVQCVPLPADGRSFPLRARLLVIADGVESALRAAAGIGVTRHDYARHAICCAVWPERAHGGTAYERFTRTGPVALLPQGLGRCGAVWAVDSSAVAELMALPERDYLAALQQAFGYRLGRIRRMGERVAYPLRRVLANQLTAPRQVLIGNAAQAVHPVGAQGFNLGLRDATALAQQILAAQRSGADWGADAVLAAYAQARSADRQATTGLSHALALGTTLDLAPARWLRTLALLAADRLEPVREHLTLAGMGFRGQTAPWALHS